MAPKMSPGTPQGATKNETKKEAKKIFDEVMKHRNSKGYFSTGYQFELGVYWPKEDSTWTNAAVIMAADCIHDITGKEKVILI